MKDSLRALIELQALDAQILAQNSFIQELPKKLKDAQGPYHRAKAYRDEKLKAQEALKKRRKELELQLEDMNQKIERLKARTSEIKTNKEYQAHLKEIEQAEASRYNLEDRILEVMEALEAAEHTLKEAQEALKTEEEKLQALRAELDSQAEKARARLQALKAQRAEMTKRLPQELYELYMNLLQRHGGSAVVEVRAEVCQGCHMNIMPQLYVEIKKNEEIIQCPQCHRILYYREEPAPEEKPA